MKGLEDTRRPADYSGWGQCSGEQRNSQRLLHGRVAPSRATLRPPSGSAVPKGPGHTAGIVPSHRPDTRGMLPIAPRAERPQHGRAHGHTTGLPAPVRAAFPLPEAVPPRERPIRVPRELPVPAHSFPCRSRRGSRRAGPLQPRGGRALRGGAGASFLFPLGIPERGRAAVPRGGGGRGAAPAARLGRAAGHRRPLTAPCVLSAGSSARPSPLGRPGGARGRRWGGAGRGGAGGSHRGRRGRGRQRRGGFGCPTAASSVPKALPGLPRLPGETYGEKPTGFPSLPGRFTNRTLSPFSNTFLVAFAALLD